MIKRTYSKRVEASHSSEQATHKRRKVEETFSIVESTTQQTIPPSYNRSSRINSSSSLNHSDATIPSDVASLCSTPPSSPPSSTAEPELTSLVQKHRTNQQMPKPKQRKQIRLTQLTLDLGQTTRKKCTQCGMTYTPSNAIDTAFHKKYHAQNVGGIDLSRNFISAVTAENALRGAQVGGDFLIAVDRSATGARRKVVESVMNVVEKELGGVGIDIERLWGDVVETTHNSNSPTMNERRGPNRYKAFLYIRGQKCIGFCLAERIQEAFQVVADDTRNSTYDGNKRPGSMSSSIAIDPRPRNAVMGISRIWTSCSARGNGIAQTLLDCATQNFLYGLKIQKDDVAFSQPTASGGCLARKWFGKDSGWLVYSD